MAERPDPATLEQTLRSYIFSTNYAWNTGNIKEGVEIIGDGADSIVFPFGTEDVVKVYFEGTKFFPQLELYKEATNKGNEYCLSNRCLIKLDNKNFQVLINPIKNIYSFDKPDTLCAISKRISGNNPWVLSTDTLEPFHQLSKQFENELGISGIFIFDKNVKIARRFPFPTLIITDLCSNIDELKKK